MNLLWGVYPTTIFWWLHEPHSLTSMFTPSLFSSLEETHSRTNRNLRKQIILCTQTRLLIRFGSPNFPLRPSSFCCSSLCVTLWFFTSICLDFRFLVFIFVHFASSLFVCLFVCLFAMFYFTCLFCFVCVSLCHFVFHFHIVKRKKRNRGTILEKLHKGGNHEND